MLFYKYIGRTPDGALKKGTIEARSKNDALRRLRNQGISPREVTETKPSIFQRDLNIGGSRMKNEDFVIYCRQFATLIRAGITIVEATDILAHQTESKLLKETLKKVEEEIKGGIAFSDSIERYTNVFPSLFVNMIRAGEMTRSLDETLDRMAAYYEKQHTLQKKIRATLMYPLVLSVLIVGVVIFLMVVIFLKFTS